jgi:hypothetical protein
MELVKMTTEDLRIKELLNEYRSIPCDENGNSTDFERSELLSEELEKLGYYL